MDTDKTRHRAFRLVEKESMMNEKPFVPEIDTKTVYSEINSNFRYFATWRYKLFAGYFALLYALSLVFKWVYKNESNHLWLVAVVGFISTLAMWGIEYRNRDIVKACRVSGEKCEDLLPDGVGFFKQLNNASPKILSHTLVLNLLFGGSAVGLLLFAILLYIKRA